MSGNAHDRRLAKRVTRRHARRTYVANHVKIMVGGFEISASVFNAFMKPGIPLLGAVLAAPLDFEAVHERILKEFPELKTQE